MKLSPLAAAGLGVVTAMSCATVALAQAKPPAKPAAAPAAAAAPPAVITATAPGVCVLSSEGIIGASTVGKYAQTRLGQLSNQVNAELGGEQTALQNDAKALDAKKATLQQDAAQQQAVALQQRYQALQQKAQLRDRELQATEQKAFARILQEANPLVADAVKQKSCGVLLNAQAVLASNPTMDITPSVVQALNVKITQFDFDREHLDTAQGAPAR